MLAVEVMGEGQIDCRLRLVVEVDLDVSPAGAADQIRQMQPGPFISAMTTRSPSVRITPPPSPLASQLTYLPVFSSYRLARS